MQIDDDHNDKIKVNEALKNERDARDGLALELDDAQREIRQMQNTIDQYEEASLR